MGVRAFSSLCQRHAADRGSLFILSIRIRGSGPSRRSSTASSGEKPPIVDLIHNLQLGRRRRRELRIRNLAPVRRCSRYSRSGSGPKSGKITLQGLSAGATWSLRFRIKSDARVTATGGRGQSR